MRSCFWGLLSGKLYTGIGRGLCFMFYVVCNLALESSAESSMQFLDSDTNFVLSCFGFVRFCLFGFSVIVCYTDISK